MHTCVCAHTHIHRDIPAHKHCDYTKLDPMQLTQVCGLQYSIKCTTFTILSIESIQSVHTHTHTHRGTPPPHPHAHTSIVTIQSLIQCRFCGLQCSVKCTRFTTPSWDRGRAWGTFPVFGKSASTCADLFVPTCLNLVCRSTYWDHIILKISRK